MNFFREHTRKVFKIGSENVSSGEQFPTLSYFRSQQNFEKLRFKEELFSLSWSFRTYQWWTILFSAKVWIWYFLLFNFSWNVKWWRSISLFFQKQVKFKRNWFLLQWNFQIHFYQNSLFMSLFWQTFNTDQK